MHIRVTYHLNVGNMPNTRAEEYAQDFKQRVSKELSPLERLVIVTHREEGGGTWSERHLVPDSAIELDFLIREGVFKVNA